jgi:hypothetical protein
MQDAFPKQSSGGATFMPRPKSELTKSGKTIGVRLTQSEYEQWIKLGASKWLRKLLRDKKDAIKVQNGGRND